MFRLETGNKYDLSRLHRVASKTCRPLLSQAAVSCQKVWSMPEVTLNLHGRDFTVPTSAFVLQVGLIPS